MRICRDILLIIGSLGSLPVSAGGADSLSVFRRTMYDASPAEALPAGILRNPAAMWYKQPFPLTGLSIGYDDDRHGETSMAQEGSGYSGFGFEARSFVPTSADGRAFGRAGYSYGSRQAVQWSETADFALLYPYVTADSAGGDLTSERYRFSGGYAHRTGLWTWAACLDYRAQLEYREKDPRPRNVVSDLQGSLAAARSIGPAYRLSLAVRGRKYGQRGDIAFYNPMYQATVYHLTGLGMDYVRFDGLYTDTYYAGSGVGGSVDLFPASRSGFSASVQYDRFAFRKQMTGLNDLPLVSLTDHTARGLLAYSESAGPLKWGVSAEGSFRKRRGEEHIFGEPAGNIYPEIGTADGYADRSISGKLSGFAGSSPTARIVWWVQPAVSCFDFQAAYDPTLRRLSFSRWHAAVESGAIRAWRRWMLRTEVALARSGKIKGELSLPGADFGLSRIRTLQQNYDRLTDDFTRLHLRMRIDCRVGNDRTIFVQGSWRRDWFRRNGTADGWTVSMGFGL